MDFDSLEDDSTKPKQSPQPSFDSLQDDSSPKSFDDMVEDPPTQYDTIPQKAVTVLEGAAQGFAGPLATLIETEAGVPKEDIVARETANPVIHDIAKYGALAGSMITGTGEAGLIAKGAEKVAGKILPAVGAFSKIGSAALASGIQMGAIQGGDEVSKAMLGQSGPEAPVSSLILHIGGAGLLGAATGGVFNAIGQGVGKGLTAAESAKIGDRANNLLAGIGMAAKAHQSGVPEKEAEEWIAKSLNNLGAGEDLDLDLSPYKDGMKLYYNGLKDSVHAVATGVGGIAGKVAGGIGGEVAGGTLGNKYLTPVLEKVLKRPLIGASKLATPVILKALSVGQSTGILDALNYASKVSKGSKAVTKAVESLFKAGVPSVVDASSRDEDDIRDFVDQGGISQQLHNQHEQSPPQYADGGEVNPEENPAANLYPEQNIMLNAARGRVATYLNSVKPQDNAPRLPFDKPIQDDAKKRSYDGAVRIAANPLSILNDVKTGAVQASQLSHLQAMYPEVYQYLRGKVTARVAKSQLEEEKLSGATKQGLSMFLGTPLDSTMTPSGIVAAQSVFAPRQPVAQPSKPKKGTSTLGKASKPYQTMSQSAEEAQNKH